MPAQPARPRNRFSYCTFLGRKASLVKPKCRFKTKLLRPKVILARVNDKVSPLDRGVYSILGTLISGAQPKRRCAVEKPP